MNKPMPGEVWMTRPKVWMPSIRARVAIGEAAFVLVVEGPDGSRFDDEPDVRVIPLLSRTDMATPDDVLLASNETGLPAPMLAATWNTQPALVRNLEARVSLLSGDTLARVVDVHDARYSNRKSEFAAGAPITSEDDPRFAYQEIEVDRWEYLHVPVGNLLTHRAHAPRVAHAQEQAAVYASHNWPAAFIAHFQICDSRIDSLADSVSPFIGAGGWTPRFMAKAVAEPICNTYRFTQKGPEGDLKVIIQPSGWEQPEVPYSFDLASVIERCEPEGMLGAA
jgi:hypothetical protein